MPDSIGRAPSNPVFARAFAEELRGEAARICGRDGRLSSSELSRALSSGKVQAHLVDNFTNYYRLGGSSDRYVTHSLSQIEADAYAYALRAATAASGTNDVLSAREARSLPSDLRADYGILTGITQPGTTLTRAEVLKAALADVANDRAGTFTRELGGADFASGSLPHEVQGYIENRGETMDELYEESYFRVYADASCQRVLGYGIRTEFEDGRVEAQILDAQANVIAER